VHHIRFLFLLLVGFALPAWSTGFTFQNPAPTSGSGDSIQFSAQFYGPAPNGYWAEFAVGHDPGPSITTNNDDCVVAYYSVTNTWMLVNDAGTTTLNPGPGQAVQNSRCMLAGPGQGTGVVNNGNGYYTVTWNIAFKNTYTGSHPLWVYSKAVGVAAPGWIQVGNWTVTQAVTSATSWGTLLSPIIEPGTPSNFTSYTTGTSPQWFACLFLDGSPYAYAGAQINFSTLLPGCGSGFHSHDLCNGTRPDITFVPQGSGQLTGSKTFAAYTDTKGCAYANAIMPQYAGTHYVNAISDWVPFPPPNQGTYFQVEDTLPTVVGGVFFPSDIGGSQSAGYVKGVPDPSHAGYAKFNSRVTTVSHLQAVAKRAQNQTTNATQYDYPSSCTPPVSTQLHPRFNVVDSASLQWGGWYDRPNFFSTYFGAIGQDPHPFGTEIDFENPALLFSGCQGMILATYLLQEIFSEPGCIVKVSYPGLATNSPILNAPLWHMECM
jgi:hypothetical protein